MGDRSVTLIHTLFTADSQQFAEDSQGLARIHAVVSRNVCARERLLVNVASHAWNSVSSHETAWNTHDLPLTSAPAGAESYHRVCQTPPTSGPTSERAKHHPPLSPMRVFGLRPSGLLAYW